MAEIETYAKPSLLYRYRPLGIRKTASGSVRADPAIIDRELGAIEERYVFCPTYPEMNDPMEGIYASTRRVQEKSYYQDFVEDVQNEKLSLGIASFSETWDNELMWAHYADGFRGICVAYIVAKLLEGLADPDASLARVAYGDRPYSLNLSGHRNQERSRAILSTKNLKWSYEREWRLFASTRGKAGRIEGAVRHVWLGARMHSSDRRAVTARLKSAGIEVRRTYVDGYTVERPIAA
jgi:Protein of unknown function (DUF2971)